MTGCVRLRVEGLMLEKLTARALNEGARFSRLTRVGRRVLLVETDAAPFWRRSASGSPSPANGWKTAVCTRCSFG